MIILYSLLFLMLLSALYLLAIPFFKRKTAWLIFFLLSLFFSAFALLIYQAAGDKKTLAFWLAEGKENYQMQIAFEQLGGVKGAISRIKEKLAKNPKDAEGWLILAKLYLATGKNTEADEAYAKAKALSP